MGLLEGKVGLVTGASSGLGRATSNLASEEGSKIVLVDINDEAGEATARRNSQSWWTRDLRPRRCDKAC